MRDGVVVDAPVTVLGLLPAAPEVVGGVTTVLGPELIGSESLPHPVRLTIQALATAPRNFCVLVGILTLLSPKASFSP